MFDFLGYTCYSPAWELFGGIFDVAFWVWFIYLAVRLRNVKRELKTTRSELRTTKAGGHVEPGGAVVWDVGA